MLVFFLERFQQMDLALLSVKGYTTGRTFLWGITRPPSFGRPAQSLPHCRRHQYVDLPGFDFLYGSDVQINQFGHPSDRMKAQLRTRHASWLPVGQRVIWVSPA
jgi:hypothetical protein